MNRSVRRPDEDEALAEAALFGPGVLEQRERQSLESWLDVPNEFERLAACLLMGRTERLPLDESWITRIESNLDQVTSVTPVLSESIGGREVGRSGLSSIATLLAVAAAFAVGVTLGWWGGSLPTPLPEIASESVESRYRSLAAMTDTTRVDWAPNAGGEVAGHVVWNDRLQQGFMAFERLPANDPKVEQYQLWIFDAARSDDHPVDGGVFDLAVDSAVQVDGMTLVPVDAKLPVSRAKMFALTVEAPGGVVVSDRSRLPGLAVVP